MVSLRAARPKEYIRLPVDVLLSTMIADHKKRIVDLEEIGSKMGGDKPVFEETEEVRLHRRNYLIALAASFGVPGDMAQENAIVMVRFRGFFIAGRSQSQQLSLAEAFLTGSDIPPDYEIGGWVQLILSGDPNYETYKDLRRFIEPMGGDFETFHRVVKELQGDPRAVVLANRY